MKLNKYILLLTLASLSLSSCKLEAPEIPAEEIYLRNFIMQFGLIDPDQDWNLAERASVTVNLADNADKVVVYANVFGVYYRVARCYEMPAGVSVIPLDIPVNTTDLAVDIDGDAYITEVNGSLDTVNKAPSRAATKVVPGMLSESNVLGWLVVAEDLGSTDDIDFNDFVARMSYTENSYYAIGEVTPDQWDVIDQQIQTEEIYFHAPSRADVGSRAGTTVVTIKAAAAGGIKKLWLHYRATESSTDYIIGPSATYHTVETNSATMTETAAMPYEWHRWFGKEDGLIINTCDNTYLAEGEKWTTAAGNVWLEPICGNSIDFEVDGSFTFTDYSEAKYDSEDPIGDYNFSFDRRQIKGFYITVDYYNVETTNSGQGTYQAYDLGQAIGQNRNRGLPPQMFLIPDLCVITRDASGATISNPEDQNHFRWPTERTLIDAAYTNFNLWVQQGIVTWYREGRQDKVVGNTFINTIYAEPAQ